MNDYDTLFKICESRKSTRVFDNRAVPAETLEQIRKVALTSPYASGKKNWQITIVTDRELLRKAADAVEKRAGDIERKVRPDMQEHFASYARNFTFFAAAPAVFVPTFRAAPSLSLMIPGAANEILQWERDNSVKSISCVAMLILLAAESIGLGGCYVTGALIAEKEIADLLRVPPGWEIGALIPVGYKGRE